MKHKTRFWIKFIIVGLTISLLGVIIISYFFSFIFKTLSVIFNHPMETFIGILILLILVSIYQVITEKR
jgi:hypothetical protein